MKKTSFLLTVLAVLLLASPVRASIEWINGTVCPNDCRKTTIPFLQGTITEYTLKGPELDYVNKIEVGSGIEVRRQETPWLSGKLILALYIPPEAAPGRRTVTLKRNDPLNLVNKVIDTLEIYIVAAGTFSAPDAWPLSNYFNQATFIVTGTKLSNAELEIAGWPQGTTATFVSQLPPPHDNLGQIKLTFPSNLAQASGDILLYDKGMPSMCKNLLATYGYKVSGTQYIRKRVTLQGPNAIKSIGFIGGPAYNYGTTITIRLTFYRPIDQQGAVIYWKLGPNTGNAIAQGISPTTYNPNAEMNQRTVNSGAAYLDLKIRVCGCLGGTWTVPVETWFGSTDNNSAPAYKASSFSVSCPAGGVACP